MKIFIIAALSVFLFPVLTFALANPASEKCIADGGTLEMDFATMGCTFPSGKKCEEWAYYRGECTSKQDVFSDIPSSHPFAEDIFSLYKKGIIEGYADGTYKPEATINRAEFTKIIISAVFSTPDIESCNKDIHLFSDIEKEWYMPYICVAKKEGIINGYADGTFQPENQITLPEAMKILLEAYQINLLEYNGSYCNEETSPYCGGTQEWYYSYLSYFIRNYYDIEKFNFIPKETLLLPTQKWFLDHKVTRGEMAYFIKKLSEKKSSYIGLTEQDATNLAEKNGVPFRVIERDGQPIPTTKDYIEGRVNASVQDGTVVSYFIEGDEKGIYKKLFISPIHLICTGIGEMECLLVRWGVKTNDREYFYDTIKNFTPEEGKEYEIIIQEKTISDVPADVLNKQYTFVHMVSQFSVPMEDEYIGLNESDAKKLAEKNGVLFRVIERDRKPLPATMDFRIGRVNAIVENGVVVSYTIEGSQEIFESGTIPKHCTSWYDGCNTCFVKDGVLGGCTKRYCIRQEEGYCIK